MRHQISNSALYKIGMENFRLADKQATARWGEALGARLRPGDVVGITGDLGAGKTTLTQAMARGMGIEADVTSPTFSLVQEYPGEIPMFHFDPYRLDRPEAIEDLGFEEYLQRGGVVVIEWAELLAAYLPTERLNITLDIEDSGAEDLDDSPRILRAETLGADYSELLAELAGLPELRELLITQKAA